MTVLKLSDKNFSAARAGMRCWMKSCLFACMSLFGALACAQENAIEAISASQVGAGIEVKVKLKAPPSKQPIGFAITNPARVAIDFASTANATGKTLQDISLGDVRNVNIVQAGERSRLVFNLSQPMNFTTRTEDNVVTLTMGSASVPPAVAAVATAPVRLPAQQAAAASVEQTALRGIDFRKGSNGEGRIVVDLPANRIGVDVRQQGKKIEVDFVKAGLPDKLRTRMDVTDFGTPVATITTRKRGENVHMLIEPQGLWEYSAYQSESQLVVEVKPIKEDPNKLTQGTQGYRGEKLSLNFQSVEVRAVLQVIADFTGLNIITSDTVSGNLTLRLKDVPWDQALDIVLRAKNLDMRKNGSVLWIAPKDELLTKEKLELEQKAQIAELEPLKMEVFQLNYQKAEAFRQVFGISAAGGAAPGGGGSNRILSKRGSATIDPRTNQLFVTDIPSKLEEIRMLVQKVDIASRQVMIEARIVEADDKFSRNLGAKLGFTDLRGLNGGKAGWSTVGDTRIALTGNYLGVGEQTLQAKITEQSYIPNSQFVSLPASGINGQTAGSIGISLFNSAANRFLNLELSALEADNKGKIISSPRVVTAD
ncbi:MAG: pilQ, partial [Burkholderiaceae bacterium]|nr:pilQ [Burkholderiaceae bacterium]